MDYPQILGELSQTLTRAFSGPFVDEPPAFVREIIPNYVLLWQEGAARCQRLDTAEEQGAYAEAFIRRVNQGIAAIRWASSDAEVFKELFQVFERITIRAPLETLPELGQIIFDHLDQKHERAADHDRALDSPEQRKAFRAAILREVLDEVDQLERILQNPDDTVQEAPGDEGYLARALIEAIGRAPERPFVNATEYPEVNAPEATTSDTSNASNSPTIAANISVVGAPGHAHAANAANAARTRSSASVEEDPVLITDAFKKKLSTRYHAMATGPVRYLQEAHAATKLAEHNAEIAGRFARDAAAAARWWGRRAWTRTRHGAPDPVAERERDANLRLAEYWRRVADLEGRKLFWLESVEGEGVMNALLYGPHVLFDWELREGRRVTADAGWRWPFPPPGRYIRRWRELWRVSIFYQRDSRWANGEGEASFPGNSRLDPEAGRWLSCPVEVQASLRRGL